MKLTARNSHPPALGPQIKDLNSGTFGFVQLALDRTTGRNVAIKFIERGDKVFAASGVGVCSLWPVCWVVYVLVMPRSLSVTLGSRFW
jgi:serine/threonine protein kinase